MTKPIVDVERFDRQIRLYGLGGQQKIAGCRVLVFKTGLEGSEMIKNLVLAGIASCSVFENRAGIFHHNNKFEIDRIKRLNPRCDIKVVADIDDEYDVIVYGSLQDEKILFKKKCLLYVLVQQYGNVGWFKLYDKPMDFKWTFDAKDMKRTKIQRKIGAVWPFVYALVTGKKTKKQITDQLMKWNTPIDEELLELLITQKSVHENGLANILSGFAAQETLAFISKGDAKLGTYSVDGYNLQVLKIE